MTSASRPNRSLVATVPFFIPSTLRTAAGLSFIEYIAVMAAIEFVAAAGIGALVVHYRDGESRTEATADDEWRFDP